MRKLIAEYNKANSPIVSLGFEDNSIHYPELGVFAVGPDSYIVTVDVIFPQLKASLKFSNCNQDHILKVIEAIQRTATPPKKKSRKKS